MANRRRLSPSQQRAAARRAAMRRDAQRKRRIRIGAAVLVVAVIAAVAVAFTGSGKKTATPATAAGSVAGKPCVGVKDKPPAGAPSVPVQKGSPPKTLVKRDLKAGTGAAAAAGDTVTVNYIGVACSTGKIFDSSYARNQPVTFALSGVIRGWQDGIPGMKVGGERLLGIPSAEAYGKQGQQGTIAPDEALWFVVELLDTKPAA